MATKKQYTEAVTLFVKNFDNGIGQVTQAIATDPKLSDQDKKDLYCLMASLLDVLFKATKGEG